MLNEHELTPEMVEDGIAMRRLMSDERQWAALSRILAKMNADAISRWERDESGSYSKKWLRGYREAATDLSVIIESTALNAESHVHAAVEAEKVTRSIAEDGLGSGDLAI